MATESLIIELDAKTKKLDASLKSTQTKLDKLDGTTKKADKSFAKFSKAATATAVAVTAVAAAITLAANKAVVFARELQVAANRSGESVERLQALAFATETVGVSLEKLGDISKDTNEKIGEFLAVGSGGFQYFADVMRLSASEAREAAEEFSALTGSEVLQEMVNQMEAAGVSSKEMSFALEGLASDTTDLIPLLTDGGKALNALTDDFNGLEITLSQADLTKIQDVGVELSKLGGFFDAKSNQAIADYSENITWLIDKTVSLGETTYNSFALITTAITTAYELANAAFNDLLTDSDTFDDVLEERRIATEEALAKLTGTTVDAKQKEQDEIFKILVTEGKKQSAWERLNDKRKLDAAGNYIKAASVLSDTFLEDNKAVNAALIVADTAAGVMRAFATSTNIYEAYGHAAVVVATGIAQLANLSGASKGGGAISGVGGSGASAPEIPQSAEPETSDLSLSSRDGDNESQSIVIRFATDTGDELLDALAGGLNERQRRGG